jgi:hypothetical protein
MRLEFAAPLLRIFNGKRQSFPWRAAEPGCRKPQAAPQVSLGSTRIDLGGMLAWPRPHCEPFRELLVHPKVRLELKLECIKVVCPSGHTLTYLTARRISRVQPCR